MRTQLASDDLVFLNAVQALSAVGQEETEIAERLGLRPESLRHRITRIRGAVVQLHTVAEVVTGEGGGDLSGRWAVTIEQDAEEDW